MISELDEKFMKLAFSEAEAGYREGGCPIGSVLESNGKVIAKGRNQRVQKGDPIAHGEMDCLRNAGRQSSYKTMSLYTTLSPCMMCAGTIVQFKIPRVIIGENETFGGNEAFLIERGVEVLVINDRDCKALMNRFINKFPELWLEDIAES